MRILIFLIFTSLHVIRGQWVDPHSMDIKVKNKLPNRSEDTPEENAQKHINIIKKECDSDIHLKRIVRLILSNAYLDDQMGYHEGYVNIRLTSAEHQLLVEFSQSTKLESDKIKEVSSIFENAFQKPASERYSELVLSVQERLYDLIFNPTSAALFGACVALYMTYKLLRAQFTWKSIIIYFLFLGYIIDVIVTYLNIVQEEEIENMVNIKKLGTVPPECDPQKMSWWYFIKTQFESTFTENPCKAYYQATYQKYLHLVAPSKILTRQFRTLILEPFGDIGEAFGKFGRGMFTSLPWGLNVVIFPIMLIATGATVFIVFLFIAKPHFKINVLHLFTIELGRPERMQPIQNNESNRGRIEYVPNRNRNRRNRNNGREVGISTNHRALVEEVSSKNSSSHGNEQTEKKQDIAKKEERQVQTILPDKDTKGSGNLSGSGNASPKSNVNKLEFVELYE